MSDSTKRHGGRRPGAGRKPVYGVSEPSRVIRVPASTVDRVRDFAAALVRKQVRQNLDAAGGFEFPADDPQDLELPLFSSRVPAGLPSQVDDHVEQWLNPTNFLVEDRENTFFVTIQGESMVDVGLMPGDKAVVNRARTAAVGDIVLAMVDGEFTIKMLGRTKSGAPRLLPANSSGRYGPIEITGEMRFEIWGVVTGSFRRFR
ncbi:MAG TPA: S24 family peptidase [Methylophilaceae bacterium]